MCVNILKAENIFSRNILNEVTNRNLLTNNLLKTILVSFVFFLYMAAHTL